MKPQHIRLIDDNPNLSNRSLARFLGISRHAIEKHREKPLWKHSGIGIPFTYDKKTRDGVYKFVLFNGVSIAKGTLVYCMENLDRLIYCLENNNGKLPPNFEAWVMKDLGFIKV